MRTPPGERPVLERRLSLRDCHRAFNCRDCWVRLLVGNPGERPQGATVNIKDFWPIEKSPSSTPQAWDQLFRMRQTTFYGFCERERQQGFLNPPVSLALAHGQEMARILMFRTLEEFVEAMLATDPDHILEELIDALNYLWSLMCLDPNVAWSEIEFQPVFLERHPVCVTELGELSLMLAATTELFRNRAWMEHAQDVYFGGGLQFKQAITACTHLILAHFNDWDEFWRYYVAKDRVLQFRLKSNY